tara:strand:+ start:477 stop:836 length:360 start_codon:yes stop_codon:yes gene_type:complete
MSYENRMVPLNGYIIGQQAPERSMGGILIPTTVASLNNKRVVVLEVGGDVTSVKPGDVVVLPQVGFAIIRQKGREFFLIKERELMAKWVIADPDSYDLDVDVVMAESKEALNESIQDHS